MARRDPIEGVWIPDSSGGGGGGGTDHGELTGLGDDDHPQYALKTDVAGYVKKSGDEMSGDLFLTNGALLNIGNLAIIANTNASLAVPLEVNHPEGIYLLNGQGDPFMPVADDHVATKKYVDNRHAGRSAWGVTTSLAGGWNTIPASDARLRWGDPAATDLSGGKLILNRLGVWRISVGIGYGWTGDNMRLVGSYLINVAAPGHFVQAQAYMDSNPAGRYIIGFSNNGNTTGFTEERIGGLPVITSISADIDAEWLGPLT